MRKLLYKSRLLCPWILLVLVTGCGSPTNNPTFPGNPPYIGLRIVQICLDTPPLYPQANFYKAANAIADRIDAAVTANQGGIEVFVDLITHNSYQHEVLSFGVPAVPSFAVAPPSPTPTNDPYQNAKLQSAYKKTLANLSGIIKSQQKHLDAVRQQVKQNTDKLRALPDVYDDTGADVFGCLQDATLHFQQQADKKYLLIASAMVNNTNLQKSNGINLAGASVKAIWRVCNVAATCQADNAYWKQVFVQFGANARDISFYDPSASDVEKPTF